MAKTQGAFRAGRVLAPDSKWTGDEPDWTGWEKWPVEQFMRERCRMLRFYSYYLNSSDLRPAVLAYMKRKKYSKSDIAAIKSANPNMIPMIIGKLVRSIDRGMPSLHPEAQANLDKLAEKLNSDVPLRAKDDHEIIRNEISLVLKSIENPPKYATRIQDLAAADFIAKPTPQMRLADKVEREVIVHLEALLDEWCANASDTKIKPVSITSYIRDGGIPPAGTRLICDWINKQLEEFNGALNKTDEQLVEGYSYMSKPALKNRVKNLESMLDDIKQVQAVAKTQRKVRVKKPKDAAKQVARLKYQTNSKDFDVDSINPERIPTAHKLYVFNTKYRTLGVYVSTNASGFEVKGSTIQGFDPDNSVIMTLRKPKDILNNVLTMAPKKLDKALSGIKSKPRKGTGRINAQTIILRVIENRI